MKTSTAIGIAAVAILALGLAFSAKAQGAKDDLVQNVVDPSGAYSPIVEVADDTLAQEGFCTGFYIGGGKFVSAGHCLAERREGFLFKSTNPNGGKQQYKVDFTLNSFLENFGGQDFSITFVDPDLTKDLTALPLACDYSPVIGDVVTMEGFPEDLGRISVEGRVAAAKATPWASWSKPLFRTQLPASYGNSGSPVMKDGKVIGILVGSLPNDRVLTAVQPISVVCKVLGIK